VAVVTTPAHAGPITSPSQLDAARAQSAALGAELASVLTGPSTSPVRPAPPMPAAPVASLPGGSLPGGSGG
jgi:hypothetical protein